MIYQMASTLVLMVTFCLLMGSNAEFQPEDYDIDPKEAFFRHLRSYDSQNDAELDKIDQYSDVPKPGGFPVDNDRIIHGDRAKRSYHILPSPGLTSHFKFDVPKPEKIRKRNKRQIGNEEPECLEDIQTTKEKITTPSSTTTSVTPSLEINDFIRFRRNSDETLESDTNAQPARPKREPEIRTEKMVMERDFSDSGADREPRKATKEQWIKQPYPVERPIEDNVPSASDNIRAPRVHFVTQRRPGQGQGPDIQPPLHPQHPPPLPPPSLPFHPHRIHDREGRARDFDPYLHGPQPYYPYARPRSYEPYRPRYYDPYYDRFDDRRFGFDYDPRYKYEEHDDRAVQPPPVHNKQRRIIYYATLPEVVRTPPPNGDRFRYRFQDGFEDRFAGAVTALPGAGAGAPGVVDTYHGRKSYNNQLQKQREFERTTPEKRKTPLYPVKVSTDVNVREPKKNPERRIYSEVDRRYPYKAPSFQTAEDTNF